MRVLKIIGILVIAVVITTLGIDATDTLSGVRGTLLSNTFSAVDNSGCPEGMVELMNHPTVTCVDIYEASPSVNCPNQRTENVLQSEENMHTSDCVADSKAGTEPWRHISREQARSACGRVQKRLLTSEEWFVVATAFAQSEQSCNVDSNSLSVTGKSQQCVTADGVYDIVGNVWEWVSDDVHMGEFNGRMLPDDGYVTQVDVAGMATGVSTTPNDLFAEDFFWSDATNSTGIIRGGYYGSREDAGIYSVHADMLPTTRGPAVGFRCGY